MTKLLQNYKHLVWIMVIMCHITVDLGNKACHTILECRLILVLLLICQQKDIGLHKN